MNAITLDVGRTAAQVVEGPQRTLKILHVIPGVAARYGGPSTVIFSMVRALNGLPNVRAEIATTDADGPDGRIELKDLPDDVPIHLFRRTWSEQWKVSLGMREWLSDHACDYDVMHIHAVWSHATVAASRAAKRKLVPYVIRPAGMFSQWSLEHRRWKKRLAWQVFHRRDLTDASAIHATSAQEANDVRAMRLTAPIAIVPNGVALPEYETYRPHPLSRKRLLFLGRIHPVKGLANLLRAWQHLGPMPDWELVLVGPDAEGHRAELEQLSRELGLGDRVRFIGPASDVEKWQWYQAADVFVLPSFTENFSVSVAEALAAGLPVITTTGTPWSEIRERQCGWWVEPTVDSLATALRAATDLSDDERRCMGQRGAAWARSRFSWPAIAGDLQQLYSWLVTGGTAPGHVTFN